MKRRVALAVAALVVLTFLGARAFRSLDLAKRVAATCDATDPEEGVTTSDGLVESLEDGDPLLPVAVECRCGALVDAGRGAECAKLITDTIDRAGGAWIDLGVLDRLTNHLLVSKAPIALDVLYTTAAPRLSLDVVHLKAWWTALQVLGGGPHILANFMPAVRRLPAEQTLELRIVVARKLTTERMTEEARAVLEPAPDSTSPDRDRWHRALADVVAASGDQLALTRVMKTWESAGGNPAYIYLVYGILLSLHHLDDGANSTLEILRGAVRAAPDDAPIEDRRLAWTRLLFGEVNAGNTAQVRALAVEAKTRGVDLDEDLLAQFEHPLAPPTGPASFATLKLPASAAGGTVALMVFGAEADAPAEIVPVPGDLTVRLPIESPAHPSRWVVRTEGGAILASGVAAREGDLLVADQAPVPPPAPVALTRARADGHRQVFVIIGDCMDWHFVRYLQARGDLPVITTMEQASVAAVLTSSPAFTGVAMEKIAHPAVVRDVTVALYAYSLGVELQGLESVGVNPLAGLKWALPDSPYLTDIVGAGPLRALNLLFAHGDIRAGRNAEIVGPHGQRTQLSLAASRLLTEEEYAAIDLGAPRSGLPVAFLQEMAAEFDAAVQSATTGDVDLLLLRVEQTDLLTHGEFPRLIQPEQDNGRAALYAAYRYVDRRLGDLIRATDDDDVVLFMSDHGIENSLVHSPDAIFMAYGLGEAARLKGHPELSGLPRVLTHWLSVEPDARWPESPLLDQLTRRNEGEEQRAP